MILRAILTAWLKYLLISLIILDVLSDSYILGRHFPYLFSYTYPKTKNTYRKKIHRHKIIFDLYYTKNVGITKHCCRGTE